MTEFEKSLKLASLSLALIGTGALRTKLITEGPRSYEVADPTDEGKKALAKYKREAKKIEAQYKAQFKKE